MLVSFSQRPSPLAGPVTKKGEILVGFDFKFNYLMYKYTVQKVSKFIHSDSPFQRAVLTDAMYTTIKAFDTLEETLYFIDEMSYAYS